MGRRVKYLGGVVLLFFVSSLYAQKLPDLNKVELLVEKLSAKQQTVFYEVANQLRCPTCTGLSVLQSDAPFSLQIKYNLLEKVKQGITAEQIRQFFNDRYGLWIFRQPPKSGMHLLAWLLPIIIFLLGGVILWFVFWRQPVCNNYCSQKTPNEILDEMYNRIRAQQRVS